MADIEGIRVALVDEALKAIYAVEPPGWTRLEPQSVSGDPRPGLEARVHDALWLLARQWQLGEFQGEDAGSPVAVHVTTSTRQVTAWQPGDPAGGAAVRALGDELLEVRVEREPTTAAGLDLRARAEAGAQLLAMLGEAGVAVDRAALLAAAPAAADHEDPFDTHLGALRTMLAGRIPDGEAAAAALEAGLASAPMALPAWLAGADPAVAAGVARAWLDWYRGSVAPRPDPGADAWIDERLEHRFGVAVGSGADQVVLRAPAFGGGRIDWYDFDAVADPGPFAEPPADAPPAAEPVVRARTTQPSPLRYGGMPADRYWGFEDGQVDLGSLEAQPHDIARLMLAEFATIYGNDWLVVPIDVPFGSFTTLSDVSYTTTFGERLTVPQADDEGRSGRFRLFEISRAGSTATIDGLFVPPAAVGVMDGPTLEEVVLLRDEMANMAWAVERVVQGPSGDPRSRSDEPKPPPITPGTEPGAELDYLLQTEVPAHWIPFVPVSSGYRAVDLRKGAMLNDGAVVEPLGVLLRPGRPMVVRDAEVPREGVRVRRVRALARRLDGSYARWTTRRVTVGRGEGSSSLLFDSAIPRRPGGG